MLARFPLEIHVWIIPLIFATGWVIGAARCRIRLHRRHPDLFEEWMRRMRLEAEEKHKAKENEP